MQIASDFATCMWYTGVDPFTNKPVTMAKGMRDRKVQLASMQFFKPDNWFTVREALIEAKRTDFIGAGCDCLIPANPPQEALDKRQREGQQAAEGDYYHTVANPAKGERPGRKTQQRRQEKTKGKPGPHA